MANLSNATHHYHIRKRIHLKHEPFPSPEKIKRVFDKLIYIFVVLSPIMNLPQLLKIWLQKDASGVSLISWTSFSFFSLVWFFYGLLHKEKPIIFMNFALMIIQAFIAVGIVLYG